MLLQPYKSSYCNFIAKVQKKLSKNVARPLKYVKEGEQWLMFNEN